VSGSPAVSLGISFHEDARAEFDAVLRRRRSDSRARGPT
jgi:hypothetical protein